MSKEPQDKLDMLEPQGPQNAKERFYERFRWLPVRTLDIIIGLLIAGTVLALYLGTR